MDPRVVLVVYIDDVTFIGPNSAAVEAALAILHAVCADLGLHIDMTDPTNMSPSIAQTALGLEFNTAKMTVGLRLPAEKLAVRALITFTLEACRPQDEHHI